MPDCAVGVVPGNFRQHRCVGHPTDGDRLDIAAAVVQGDAFENGRIGDLLHGQAAIVSVGVVFRNRGQHHRVSDSLDGCFSHILVGILQGNIRQHRRIRHPLDCGLPHVGRLRLARDPDKLGRVGHACDGEAAGPRPDANPQALIGYSAFGGIPDLLVFIRYCDPDQRILVVGLFYGRQAEPGRVVGIAGEASRRRAVRQPSESGESYGIVGTGILRNTGEQGLVLHLLDGSHPNHAGYVGVASERSQRRRIRQSRNGFPSHRRRAVRIAGDRHAQVLIRQLGNRSLANVPYLGLQGNLGQQPRIRRLLRSLLTDPRLYVRLDRVVGDTAGKRVANRPVLLGTRNLRERSLVAGFPDGRQPDRLRQVAVRGQGNQLLLIRKRLHRRHANIGRLVGLIYDAEKKERIDQFQHGRLSYVLGESAFGKLTEKRLVNHLPRGFEFNPGGRG